MSEHQWELSPCADGFAEEVHYKRTYRLFGQSTVEVTRRRIPVEPSRRMVDPVEGLGRDVVHELRPDLRFNQDRLPSVVRRELAEGLKAPALSGPTHITTADCVAIGLNKYPEWRSETDHVFYRELAAPIVGELQAQRGTSRLAPGRRIVSDAQKALAAAVSGSRNPAPLALDAKWQTVRSRQYVWLHIGPRCLPHDRPRSVLLPAALLTVAICGAPFLLFAIGEAVAR